MRHDSLGGLFVLSSSFILHSAERAHSHAYTIRTRTHTHIGNRRLKSVISNFYTLYDVTIFKCHNFSLSHIHNLIIIDKKYTLSYVYWDHTNTSQGYINIRFFSLCYLSFFEFSPRQAPRVATFSDLTRFQDF